MVDPAAYVAPSLLGYNGMIRIIADYAMLSYSKVVELTAGA